MSQENCQYYNTPVTNICQLNIHQFSKFHPNVIPNINSLIIGVGYKRLIPQQYSENSYNWKSQNIDLHANFFFLKETWYFAALTPNHDITHFDGLFLKDIRKISIMGNSRVIGISRNASPVHVSLS